MIERRIRPLIGESLADTRVVMVMGARQVGKSTLCEAIAASEQRQTVSLDEQASRENAIADPAGFLAGFDGPVFIDEVQRVPELILAIKRIVDREQQPGRFLGAVLHGGEQTLPLGDRLWAIPVSGLWA